ncbi:MAG TPA: malto-oligosyltrehalose trehalohydrolase [Chitinispirillaceae bacterium]|nr:malto-oligosyltrehalose trehalohydrolase [Chitinispirillaceae bacterium]
MAGVENVRFIDTIGTTLYADKRCFFRLWAPQLHSVDLICSEHDICVSMEREADGYWNTELKNIDHGCTYNYRFGNKIFRPDPASQWQPKGVHGVSAVVDHSRFEWSDNDWKGIPLEQYIIYEIHTGTFSPEGTFDGIINKLPYLQELGVTALEIMPIAQFPGKRNWGYDGVYPFAVQTSYGGVEGFKRLVNQCHKHQLAVILDVVYNHLGPEGNYLWEYGPYFTKNKYQTPWGWAVNFDDELSDHVRSYFITNAIYWMEYFHVDALRLDAIHAIYDMNATTFLENLSDAVNSYNEMSGRKHFLIAENDRNDPRVVRSVSCSGYGIDAQWCDDLHHAIHAVITGENQTYYQDYGSCSDVAKALSQGFVHDGNYSKFRKRRHGASAVGLDSKQCVVCCQNHDQIGNRAFGERLIALSTAAAARCAAAVTLLSPMIPLLFMGEEWGEKHPFQYFVDHSDPALYDAVRNGRAKEYSLFHLSQRIPDPFSESTFTRSKIDWSECDSASGVQFANYYRYLLRLRKMHPVLSTLSFNTINSVETSEERKLIILQRVHDGIVVCLVYHFGASSKQIALPYNSHWRVLLDSSNEQWGGDTIALTSEFDGNESVITAMSVKVYESKLPGSQ